MRKIFTLTIAFTFSALLASAAENVFTVTDEILVKNPPRFGMNFGTSPFKPWDATQTWNAWNEWYSCEPIIFRHASQSTGGGTDYIEDVKGQPCAPNPANKENSTGAGFFFVFQNGFWNGADIWIYRETKDSVELIRKDKVKAFYSPAKDTTGPERIELEGKGEPVKKGDVYVMHMERTGVPEAVTAPDVLRNSKFTAPTPSSGVIWEIDPSTKAPEGGSTASLKMTLPGASTPVGIQHQFLRWGGKELDFKAGKKYRCDIWLRQEELNGPVTVQLGDRITKTLRDVTGEWKKYSFDIPNDKPVGPDVYYALIGSTGKGTLWMDNWLVYEDGVEPFAIDPEWLNALKQLKPGIIRDMGGRGLYSLDGWLSHGFQRKFIWDTKSGVQTGWGQGNIALPQLLQLCKETGAAPYLMTYFIPTDEEIDGLMEYLGAPADTGYGKIRAEHGHQEPWINEFNMIYVECANEVWNGMFKPQALPGQPDLCGKVASRVFRRMKQSPWFKEGQFRFVAPSWVTNLKPGGWTDRAFGACPEADLLGVAPSGYIGGWDGETIIGTGNDDDLFQANLFYSAQHFEPKLTDINDMKKRTGRDFGTLKYEAGPGYSLPSPESVMIEEEERVQKSLALGTVTLDNFMFVLANNGNVNYFKMKKDPKWATHNHDMIPHNTFLAMQLRNAYCSGDLLQIKEGSQHTANLPAQQAIGLDNNAKRVGKMLPAVNNVPYVRLYAFKENSRYSFIAVNRNFKEAETVTVELPYDPQSGYTVYMLTGDPRDTNRSGEKLKIAEEKKTGFSRKFTFELPPASCCTIVNEAK